MSSGVQHFDLLAVIHQYIADHLEEAQLLGTRGAFIHECNEFGLPSVKKTPKTTTRQTRTAERTKSKLYEAFDSLDYHTFFKLWNSADLLPHAYGSKAFAKLNFRLHVQFNCRLMAERKITMTECMKNVRDFFDHEGAILASEQEYIHFFALPFVIEPQAHPTFKILFEASNWMRLRSDLGSYVEELREKGAHESDLAKIIKAHLLTKSDLKLESSHNNDTTEKDKDLERMRQLHAQLLANHQKLKGDHQKLIAVAKELTTALELAAKSGGSKKHASFTWSSVVLKCSQIYPELFSSLGDNGKPTIIVSDRASTAIGNHHCHQKELEHSTAQPAFIELASEQVQEGSTELATTINRPKSSPSESKEPNNKYAIVLYHQPPPVNMLNFDLIKERLTKESHKRQSLLLIQSLRWLLTRSTNGERKSYLTSYLTWDILGLKAKKESSGRDSNQIMEILSRSGRAEDTQQQSPNDVHNLSFQQSLVRLMNAMASIKSGRDYLGNYSNIVGMLIKSLTQLSSGLDYFTVDMIVATLQKLSLKYLVRRQMIESGMVEWLITHLRQFVKQDDDNLSAYGLEYSTALFMNLCLHKSGKLRCLPMAQDVLGTFVDLLSLSNIRQILPYVNGTLYSLLTNPKIAASAKDLNISEKLKLAITATANDAIDEEAKQQISFVLQQYEESSSPSSSDSSSLSSVISSLSDDGYEDDEESNDEDVDIEDEVDLHDPVEAAQHEICGNALLNKEFVITDEVVNDGRLMEAAASSSSVEELIESNEDKAEMVKEKIIEEEFSSGSSRRKVKKGGGSELSSPRKQPCSFFISTSPPLPSMINACLPSEVSSTSGESKLVSPTKSSKSSSDTDEGVVLVMDKEAPASEVTRASPFKSKRSSRHPNGGVPGIKRRSGSYASSSRRSSTTSSNGSAKGTRATLSGRSRPIEPLPKIGATAVMTTTATTTNATSSSPTRALSSPGKKESLLSKVAVALPLLPPLPTPEPIDQAKQAGGMAQFTVAGADAFSCDVQGFPDESSTTVWKLPNGQERITMSLSEEKLECSLYMTPPSPRKRWKKLNPINPNLKSVH